MLTGLAWPRPTRAQGDLPGQLLFPPLPVAPFDFDEPAATDLRLWVAHLPDHRRAESYAVGSWFRFGHHGLRWEVSYHGIESSERVQYGGGPFSLQWSWHLSEPGRGGLALDLLGVSPTGDMALHPVSARAPSLHARVRWSPLGGESGRVWLGFFTRRVSPPEDRNQPLASFPSGSGFDLIARLRAGDWTSEFTARQDLAGLPDQTWLGLRLARTLDDRLAVEAGAATTLGPADRRLLDLGWTLGIRWAGRPPPGPR